tara:strand:+ start:232 stop:480 length:249 start_codon:yes stop_codon:yes gene_type:complete
VAHTPVTTHIHQALDIHRDFATKVTLDSDCGDLGTQTISILLRKVVNLGITANARLIADPLRGNTADAVHRGERDLNMFVRG